MEKASPSIAIWPVFEVHGSKFKLDPVGNLGQASVLRITHGVFFLGVGKDPFNGLFPPLVEFLVFGSIILVYAIYQFSFTSFQTARAMLVISSTFCRLASP